MGSRKFLEFNFSSMEENRIIKYIDFNCDLAQSEEYKAENDAELIENMSSLNISCGFHAGDPLSIKKVLEYCRHKSKVIGASIGFPKNSAKTDYSKDEIEAIVLYQIGALASFAKAYSLEIEHVRPHGEMYKICAENKEFALSVAKSIQKFSKWLIYYGEAGEIIENIASELDINVAREIHLDKNYSETGVIDRNLGDIENTEKSITNGLYIEDEIPDDLTVNKVIVNGQEQEMNEEEGISNYVLVAEEIPANSEIEVQIETTVNYASRESAETITNRAIATIFDEEVASTSDINHIIEADIQDEEPGGEGGEQNGEQNGEQGGNVANGDHMISGMAWYDANTDGRKDANEESLEGITVRLLNVGTNQLVKNSSGSILSVVTDGNGMYVLDNIQNGQYIVIFDYDKNQYSLTKYKAEGVSETDNSDASLNELLVGETRQEVASTDIINVSDSNISDISIGLIESQNFDLKLDKYVSKIVVQNSAGTTVREYSNTNTAKIELDAKQMNGSTVIVEYSIIVTNVGEVAGYARNIIDYMPNDLEFSSELNKDWYESNNSLYTTALGNEIINPGESKTVTLTLTKTMGEDNIVSRNNAEIYEDYNDLGLSDSNSTPGNNTSGENDMSSADVIISIRTGGVIYMTIGVVLAIIVVAGIATGIIVKRKNSKSEE